MTRLSDEDVVRLVRKGLSRAHHTSLDADLWFQVRERIEHGAPPPAPWEWALTAVVALVCLLHPAVLSVLLLNL